MHVSDPVGGAFPDAPIESVNLTTAQVYWNQVETAPGQYDFTRLDEIVSTSRSVGAKAMVVLGFTPAFHAAQPASPTARATMPDLGAWERWVSAVVDRYGDRIDYQVWPEPNIVSNWEDSPTQMAQLTAVAGRIIEARAPEALVVAPATTLRLAPQQRWMDRFWASEPGGRPVARWVDAVALDPFPLEEGSPEVALDLICDAQDVLADNGVDLPLWTNEINYGVPSGGPSTGVAPYPDDKQAAVVARTYVLHAAMGMDRVYWLGWFSYPGLAVALERDGVTTPAGEAYTRTHGWLADGSRPTCRIENGVHVCEAERRGRTTTVVWRERGEGWFDVAPGTTSQSLSGKSTRVGAPGRVRVGPSPVALLPRG